MLHSNSTKLSDYQDRYRWGEHEATDICGVGYAPVRATQIAQQGVAAVDVETFERGDAIG